MTADRPIPAVLAEFGFVAPAERAAALAVLVRRGLTRPGKSAISTTKLLEVQGLLETTFALSCGACMSTVRKARPDAQLLVVADERCENCEGSDHRAAALRFITACQRGQVDRVVIVGGNPTSREALKRLLGALRVELVDGTGTMTAQRA